MYLILECIIFWIIWDKYLIIYLIKRQILFLKLESVMSKPPKSLIINVDLNH